VCVCVYGQVRAYLINSATSLISSEHCAALRPTAADGASYQL
jgi:hypothetical protein